MALTQALAEAIARELSPEHFAHGWRPAIEAEVSAAGVSAGQYLGDRPALEFSISLEWKPGGEHQGTCPCGELIPAGSIGKYGAEARDLLVKVTGLDLIGEVA